MYSRHAVRELVGDDVEPSREEVDRLTAGRDARRQALAEQHDAVAGVEGVQIEVWHEREELEEVRAPRGVHEANEREVAIVEPAAGESLVVVVVRPAHIDVSVDDGAVGPRVVGVRAQVVCRQLDDLVQVVDRAEVVAAHVVGVDGRRPQPVGRHELPAARRDADLLGVAEHALPAPDGALRLEVAEVERDAAVACIDEVLPDVALRGGAHAPCQHVAVALGQDHELRRPADLDPGAGFDDLAGAVGLDSRRGVDVDAFVDVAERGDDLAAPQLFGDIGAEHPDAAVVLVVALVRASGHERIVATDAKAQLTRSAQAVEARCPIAEYCGRAGRDGDAPATWLLRGNRHQPDRQRAPADGRGAGTEPGSPPSWPPPRT